MRPSRHRASGIPAADAVASGIEDRAAPAGDRGQVRSPDFAEAAEAGAGGEDGSHAGPESREAAPEVLGAVGAEWAPRDLAVVEPARLVPGPGLIFARDPNHPRSERVRLLRTELLLRLPASSEMRAIALVGACAGEGRSLLAAELALSFSQLGRETLLVDVDFRRPRQHVLFGSTLTDGLAQAISGDRPPMFSRVEGFPSLAVMTAGACPPNPLELLMDWRFESLVGEWERKFEFIVLDTPPVNEFADALAVATVAGRVLLTGRAKRTSYRDAREMLRRLAATEAQILGSVLNHF
jgi:receptor protein-tyrosine kinase